MRKDDKKKNLKTGLGGGALLGQVVREKMGWGKDIKSGFTRLT